MGKRHPVEPITNWNVYIGDIVEILVGKDKGKIGMVNDIVKERNWVFVENRNTKLQVAEMSMHESAAISFEGPLLADTQIKLVDPTDRKGCEIEWRYTEEGGRVRVSTRSGRIIPFPKGYKVGPDGVVPADYKASKVKDTTQEDLLKVTFDPKIMTFEEEMMEVNGIKDDRKRAKTYWY